MAGSSRSSTVRRACFATRRGTSWFPARASGRGTSWQAAGQIQVEIVAGGAFNLGGPGTLFAVAVPIAGEQAAGPVDLALAGRLAEACRQGSRDAGGFGSFADGSRATPSRHRRHARQPGTVELFVESGAARLVKSAPGGKPTVTDVKAGECRAIGRSPAASSGARPSRSSRRSRGT